MARSSIPASSPHATATMRANRHRDTGPEVAIRSLLHAAGLRFRVDRRVDLAEGWVRPDITFGPARVAVFVDGCFWHRCPEHGELPRANRELWRAKLQRTVDRDEHQTAALAADGWSVLRFWEHQDPADAAAQIAAAVRSRSV